MTNGILYSLKLILLTLVLGVGSFAAQVRADSQQSPGMPNGPVFVMRIDGSINPATDDYLKTTLKRAESEHARLLVLELNTPGGLLNSTQTMVSSILDSKVPVAVYVSPSGGGATSAGVFITLSGHFAVMAPGTTIGAAHPVTGSGEDVSGDMRAKVENYAASFMKAIAEQRGRNVAWAEKAVRESVSITDREALTDGVVDFVASDMQSLLGELENRTATINGNPVSLSGVSSASRETVEMSFKQRVINILADPNIAILIGLAAMLGIGIELYHPGGILPGVIGVICLVLSLTAAQVLPINYGGLILLVLSAAFFVLEFMLPSFGLWGSAGVVCLVLGSIYLIDDDLVWGDGSVQVNEWFVGSLAAGVGLIMLAVVYVAISATRRKVTTGKEGLIGKAGEVKAQFVMESDGKRSRGKVFVSGELWDAYTKEPDLELFSVGERVEVVAIEGLRLTVRRLTVTNS